MAGKDLPLSRSRPGSGAGEERMWKIIGILVLFLAVWLVLSFFVPFFWGFLLKTEVAENFVLDYDLKVQGVLGFKESVTAGSQSGRVEWLKEEGRRVAVGEAVARILPAQGEEIIVRAPAAGVFTRQIDGLEGLVYPHKGWVPERPVFAALQPKPREYPAGSEVPAGSPLFKIVDNFHWYYTLILPSQDLELLEESSRLLLAFSFAAGPCPVDAWTSRDIGDGYHFIVLSLSRDVGDFYRRRREEARLIYQQQRAVSLPAAAVVEKEGQKGVFRIARSALVFEEIEILAELEGRGRRLAVLGLEPGWEIVTNPRFFREGQRF
jgi:putative membrane fusion protein